MHIMLGSDAPFGAPADHLANLARLGLPAGQHGLDLYGNAERMLGLSKGANA